MKLKNHQSHPNLCHQFLVDLSLNKELLMYQLKYAVDGQSWYTPKDYTVIVNHLYHHLKQLNLVKSMDAKATDSLSKSAIVLLQQCYEYKKGISEQKPEVDGVVYVPGPKMIDGKPEFTGGPESWRWASNNSILADLGMDCAELGYISIEELTEYGAELDLHWTPKTLREVKA